MKINEILTYGTLIFIGFYVAMGFKRGIAGSLVDLIGYVAGFAFAPSLKVALEPILKPAIIRSIYLLFGSALDAKSGDALALVNEAVEMSQRFTDTLNSVVGMNVEKFAQILLYVFSFLIISAIVIKIVRLTNILEALPFAGQLSRIVGGVFGLIVSQIYVQMFSWMIRFLYESCNIAALGELYQGISTCVLLQTLCRINIAEKILDFILKSL